jgi:hypothetical protein
MNKTLKSALLSAAVLLVGSSIFASNMGFKLVYPLKAFNTGVHDGNNWVSVPYFNSFATQDAAGIWADLISSNRLRVIRYNPVNSTFQRWSGGGAGQTNFPIAVGESYNALVTADANWTIVGSHDNAFAKPLTAFNTGVHDGNNYTSLPYHTNKTTANGVWGELPAQRLRILRYNPVNSTFQRWSGGGAGQTDFAITIGESYIVLVTADTTWTPAHY